MQIIDVLYSLQHICNLNKFKHWQFKYRQIGSIHKLSEENSIFSSHPPFTPTNCRFFLVPLWSALPSFFFMMDFRVLWLLGCPEEGKQKCGSCFSNKVLTCGCSAEYLKPLTVAIVKTVNYVSFVFFFNRNQPVTHRRFPLKNVFHIIYRPTKTRIAADIKNTQHICQELHW